MSAAVTSDQLFRMPTLGADMTEGRVVEWLVAPGSEVQRGDLVAVVETDKSDIEIEVFEPCIFEEYLVELGELVDVGTPIARIRPLDARAAPGGEAAAPIAEVPSAATAGARSMRTPDVPPTAAAPIHSTRADGTPVTPRARRLAAERGIDPAAFLAPGDDWILTGDRLLELHEQRHEPPGPPSQAGEVAAAARPAGSIRAAIASSMERSWRTIPHYHVTSVIDVTDVEERLARRNAEVPTADRMLLAAPLHAAIARAAADVPSCNGWWRDGGFDAAAGVDLGVVVALRTGGIVVPTIAAADELDATAMMRQLREIVERARRGRLRGSDLTPASLTVTSLGERGARSVSGVIHPPQVALVGLGSVHEEPVVVDGSVRARRVVHVTIAGDHRAHDGLTAARLLTALERHLEELP